MTNNIRTPGASANFLWSLLCIGSLGLLMFSGASWGQEAAGAPHEHKAGWILLGLRAENKWTTEPSYKFIDNSPRTTDLPKNGDRVRLQYEQPMAWVGERTYDWRKASPAKRDKLTDADYLPTRLPEDATVKVLAVEEGMAQGPRKLVPVWAFVVREN